MKNLKQIFNRIFYSDKVISMFDGIAKVIIKNRDMKDA